MEPFKEPTPEDEQDGFCLGLDSSSGLISMSSWLCDLGQVSYLSVLSFILNVGAVL